jgi:hypothetical protein
MAEVGIDITREFPKPWTDETVRAADVVVTMGCGDSCPYFPGKRYEEWALPDPAGQSVDAVRPIRDEVERRVRVLLGELGMRPYHQGAISSEIDVVVANQRCTGVEADLRICAKVTGRRK